MNSSSSVPNCDSLDTPTAMRLYQQKPCCVIRSPNCSEKSCEHSGDFDAVWDPTGVDLDQLDEIFFDFTDGRRAQKQRFGGELLPNVVETGSGLIFADFFQGERDTGRKGIVVIDPRRIKQ
jgi:hypothetical protein